MNDFDTQKEFAAIRERNKRVEADKAWELSWTRRLFIVVITYVFAALWLLSINDTNPFLKALIPIVGYLLSTITLPPLRRWWIKSK